MNTSALEGGVVSLTKQECIEFPLTRPLTFAQLDTDDLEDSTTTFMTLTDVHRLHHFLKTTTHCRVGVRNGWSLLVRATDNTCLEFKNRAARGCGECELGAVFEGQSLCRVVSELECHADMSHWFDPLVRVTLRALNGETHRLELNVNEYVIYDTPVPHRLWVAAHH